MKQYMVTEEELDEINQTYRKRKPIHLLIKRIKEENEVQPEEEQEKPEEGQGLGTLHGKPEEEQEKENPKEETAELAADINDNKFGDK